MDNILTTGRTQVQTSELRRRAVAKLKKDLAIKKTSPRHEVGQQLYELRINQIEVELLSEEFNRLKRKISAKNQNSHAFSSSRHGYFFLDREGVIHEAKFPVIRPADQNGSKWKSRSLADCISPGKRALFQDFLHDVFESDEKKSCELIFEPGLSKKNIGLKLPLYAVIEAVADDEKQLCLAVIEDVSAQKIADERESNSRAAMAMLEKTIAASHNEIFMFDAQNLRFNFANQRALENLGYTLSELKSLTHADILTNTSNEEMNELITHLLEHRKSAGKLHAVHRRKDGSLYPVEIHLQLFEQDTSNAFIAIVLDISSQASIESQLKSIVESAGAIIWAANNDFKLVFMSDQVMEILGYNTNQFIGYSLTELLDAGFFHESDKAKLSDGFNQLITTGKKVSDLRYRAKHADGTWRWFNMNMATNRSVDGQAGQLVGVMHDIHAQKLAEEALLQLNQELDSRVRDEIQKNMDKDLLLQRQARLAGMGEMIGNIAHQWRQPINSLGLILSDLEDASLYGECNLAYIQTAVSKSKNIIQKMSSTIDDFRHFFRADKSLGTFNLKQVSDECLNLVEAAMKSNNINIVVRCEHDVFVSGYANEYSQALMNILSNAKDAIVDRKIAEGEIIIEIGEEGGFGVHTVTDNGGGIPEEVLPKIFEPHFTTKTLGVGIGLYMTLVSIEKNMRGRISAENVPGGTRFSVYLPKAQTVDELVIR